MGQRVDGQTTEETTKSSDRNPYLFIVGCARSGTTLLQRIVDAHPQIAITPSMHWISGYFKRRKVSRPEDPVTSEMVSGLLVDRKFDRFRIRREELEGLIGSGEPVPYSRFLAGIFHLYGKTQGKPLVGNKTAPYVRRLPALHALWPKARFVHLIRDGRDVCLSVMNWSKAEDTAGRYATWTEDPVTTIALWWKRKVLLGREAGKSLGPNLYQEIRYEELVSEPAKACETLCSFLELPYAEAMLRFDERRDGTHLDIERAHPSFPITRGLRDWRSQMTAEEVERFEAAAGDLLDELGYTRAYLRLSPQALEHASKMHNLFTQDLHSNGGQLPERWELA
jgi:Sulfotransferase family